MDIMTKVQKIINAELYRDLVEYIEELKDQAWSDGFDQGQYTEYMNHPGE